MSRNLFIFTLFLRELYFLIFQLTVRMFQMLIVMIQAVTGCVRMLQMIVVMT